MSTLYATTPIQYVDIDGTRLAYREFGEDAGVPLVMCNRFRGSWAIAPPMARIPSWSAM